MLDSIKAGKSSINHNDDDDDDDNDNDNNTTLLRGPHVPSNGPFNHI